MQPLANLLAPRPRRVDQSDERFNLPRSPSIGFGTGNPGLRPSLEKLSATLRRIECDPQIRPTPNAHDTDDSDLFLTIRPDRQGRAQGYELTISACRIEIIGWDEPGLFYGVCTLSQWISLHGHDRKARSAAEAITLTSVHIVDWPDFLHRGVLLDISRDKVPTMETLYELVDRLSGWKINQLQLYMEHTFAYRGHEEVWEKAGALTADEVRSLDAYCNFQFIQLVPNQNSFGHFHRWLSHAKYRHLAECPNGIEHPFSSQPEPFSLCPTDPEALDLLEDLYGQLLPQFSSRLFNVGLDETIDLGLGRSATPCTKKGKDRIYLNFLRNVYRLVIEQGRQMQFWADMVLQFPDIVAGIPRDAIALVWGYEADHPFAEETQQLAQTGLAHYVCPGTSSWNSFSGRSSNALANLSNAAIAGSRSGALGYLITDWGDNGHLQPLAVSYLGYLAGACLSWNPDRSSKGLNGEISALLSFHAFQGDEALGEAAQALGDLHLTTGANPKNGSALFYSTVFFEQSLDGPRYRGLDKTSLEEARLLLQEISERLSGSSRIDRPVHSKERRELEWVAAMLGFSIDLAVARLDSGRSGPLSDLLPNKRQIFAQRLEPLIEERRHIWLLRNRPEGLEDSLSRLHRLRNFLKST